MNKFKGRFEGKLDPINRIADLEQQCKECYERPVAERDKHTRALSNWGEDCGYTRREIERAKRYVSSLR